MRSIRRRKVGRNSEVIGTAGDPRSQAETDSEVSAPSLRPAEIAQLAARQGVAAVIAAAAGHAVPLGPRSTAPSLPEPYQSRLRVAEEVYRSGNLAGLFEALEIFELVHSDQVLRDPEDGGPLSPAARGGLPPQWVYSALFGLFLDACEGAREVKQWLRPWQGRQRDRRRFDLEELHRALRECAKAEQLALGQEPPGPDRDAKEAEILEALDMTADRRSVPVAAGEIGEDGMPVDLVGRHAHIRRALERFGDDLKHDSSVVKSWKRVCLDLELDSRGAPYFGRRLFQILQDRRKASHGRGPSAPKGTVEK